MIRVPFAVLFAAVSFASIAHAAPEGPKHPAWTRPEGTEMLIETKDGVKLHATFNRLRQSTATVVLIPMLGNTEITYSELIQDLAAHNYSTLVYDQRGHGGSTQSRSGQIDYKNFKNAPDGDWGKLSGDLAAVVEQVHKLQPSNAVIVIGASIGANAALNFAATDPAIRAMVLLSPGEEYHGLHCVEAAAKYGARPLLVVVSKQDEYSANSCVTIAGEAKKGGATVALEQLNGSQHGTSMLNEGVRSRVTKWIDTGHY